MAGLEPVEWTNKEQSLARAKQALQMVCALMDGAPYVLWAGLLKAIEREMPLDDLPDIPPVTPRGLARALIHG